MQALTLHDHEFVQYRDLIFRIAGISLSDAKKSLVAGRLAKRVSHHGLQSFADYFRLISQRRDELQVAVDLLTTNETHFFREPRHFDLLKSRVLAEHPRGRNLRVWSAASSSGEEPYTLAMVLAESLGDAPWEILGSDLSTRVLERARAGLYPMERAQEIPTPYLKAYCLKGIDSQEGSLLIDARLRARMRFEQINLIEPFPDVGSFDVIFLRNVMIYFQQATKRQVISQLLAHLRPGGWFFVGHSESLGGLMDDTLKLIAPSVYQKR